MNKKNGFTILEVMVALAIFSIVAAAAMSFYKFQTRESAISSRKKIAQEAATLALMRLKRDIIGAGLGLSEKDVGREDLAMFVVDGGGAAPDELYLSSAPYLDMDLTPTKPDGSTPQRFAFFPYGSARPGEDKAWFTLNGSNELVLSDVSFSVDQRALGALIIRNEPSGVRYVSRTTVPSLKVVPTKKADLTIAQKEKGQHDVTFELSGGITGEVAPAVRYWLNTAQDTSNPTRPNQSRGTLMRNDVALVGAQATVTGFKADALAPLMKVTDFQVRCLFDDGNWSPDTVAYDSTGHGLANLRLVEVTVRYIIRSGRSSTGGYATPDKVKDPKFRISGDDTVGRWSIGGTIVLRATPRNIVLTQYLGGE